MNIYWRELAINIKAMLIWFFILSGLGVLVIAFFPTVAKQAESFQQLMTGMPKGLLAAFGLEQISMTDIMGFYATKQYTTLTLFGSVYAIMLAAGILSKEENDRTIEFLLSKPVSRSAVIGAKLLSTITLVAFLNLLITIVMYISLEVVKTGDYSIKLFLLLSLAALLLHLTFAALGFLASVIIRRSQNVLPVSLGLVMVTYFLGIASVLSEKLEFLKYFSPFKYVDAVDILTRQKIDPMYLLMMVFISVIAVVISYYLYRHKDFAV